MPKITRFLDKANEVVAGSEYLVKAGSAVYLTDSNTGTVIA